MRVATLVGAAAGVAVAVYLLHQRRRRHFYPIGTAGVKWGDDEREEWRSTRRVVRSYSSDVVAPLVKGLPSAFALEAYGALSVEGGYTTHDGGYTLYAARTKAWSPDKPCVLVTGGVHGYETSGVQGALRFLTTRAAAYAGRYNVVVVPCVSPWGYETIQRWNPAAVDPNRSFNPRGELVAGRPFNPEPATAESAALISYLESLGVARWLCHVDCHETTDTDETEFTPARCSRDGLPLAPDPIPDGFFVVCAGLCDGYPETGDGARLRAWHEAILNGVRAVTHIAPADADGLICGDRCIQAGAVGIPNAQDIGLCAGVTNAPYAVTTEVYPDSPRVDAEICNRAQVAAITSALDHLAREAAE
jgi:hypothetical protein